VELVLDPEQLEAAVDLGPDEQRVCVEVHGDSWCLLPVEVPPARPNLVA
jgi:hypothetical protein